MKIGLINFTYTYNYGAILQCLALNKVLLALGHEVKVINYIPPTYKIPSFWQGWGLRSGKGIRQIKSRWIDLIHGAKTRRKFELFMQGSMKYTDRCTTAGEVQAAASQFDALVVGSDQVWNECFFHNPVFFIGFPYGGIRISYAACCGHTPDDNSKVAFPAVRTWIQAFDHISVRNEFTREYVEQLTGRECDVVADPTLLYDYPVEIKIPANWTDRRYIVVYILGEEIKGGHRAAIKLIREKHGDIPVVVVTCSAHLPKTYDWADLCICDADPGEWLGWIASAEFFYTDSFHGMLFALKFKKPFLAYYAEEDRAERLLDVSDRYGVRKFVVNSIEDIADQGAMEDAPDYDSIDEKIKIHAEHSMKFLKSATY